MCEVRCLKEYALQRKVQKRRFACSSKAPLQKPASCVHIQMYCGGEISASLQIIRHDTLFNIELVIADNEQRGVGDDKFQ